MRLTQVIELNASDSRCATGEYDLPMNVVSSSGVTQLILEETLFDSCVPGEYKDYFLPLTAEHDMDANLRFDLELRGDQEIPTALLLQVHHGELPTDRKTELYADHAVDGIWSVMVNVVDLSFQLCSAAASSEGVCANGVATPNSNASIYGSARHRKLAGIQQVGGSSASSDGPDLLYFASVKCTGAEGMAFKLRAVEVRAQLPNGLTRSGEVCPGSVIYHHWEHSHVGELRNVKFHFTAHAGDGKVVVRGTELFDGAPLKLEPPYDELTHAELHHDVGACGVRAHSPSSPFYTYVAIFGGEHCLAYDVVASELATEEVCVTQSSRYYGGSGGHHADESLVAKSVSPHHAVYDSCEPGEWVDYVLTLMASDSHYNYVIEVSQEC